MITILLVHWAKIDKSTQLSFDVSDSSSACNILICDILENSPWVCMMQIP